MKPRCLGPDCRRPPIFDDLCAAHDAQRQRGWPLRPLPKQAAITTRARERRRALEEAGRFDRHTSLYLNATTQRALRDLGVSVSGAMRHIAAGGSLAELWGCRDIVDAAARARKRRTADPTYCLGPGCCRVATHGNLCRAHYDQRRRSGGGPLRPLAAHAESYARRSLVLAARATMSSDERAGLVGMSVWTAAKTLAAGGSLRGAVRQISGPAPCAFPGCQKKAQPKRRRGLCLRHWRAVLRAGLPSAPAGGGRRGPVERALVRG